jgi:thioesterase domain-containing protein
MRVDISVQYYLAQAGLVRPSVKERRLEMVREKLVRNSAKSMVVSKSAMGRYRMRPVPVHVTLFRAEHNPERTEAWNPTLGWGDFATKGVDVVVVPGNHMVIIRHPFAKGLGRALQEALNKVAEDG